MEAHFRGNLGQDPETHKAGESTVTRFRVAEHQARRPADSPPPPDPVWVGVEVWGEHGERCADLFRKGDPVLVSGRWLTQTWSDDDGNKHSKTFVRANAVGPDLSRCSVRGLSRLGRREPDNVTTAAATPANPNGEQNGQPPIDPFDEK